ncbi:MAG: hypothetical protein ACLVJH_19180 [Faecalibacterium prausnitzii]
METPGKECLQDDLQRHAPRSWRAHPTPCTSAPAPPTPSSGFAKGEADRAQIGADRGEHTFWHDAINDPDGSATCPRRTRPPLAEHGFEAVDEPSCDAGQRQKGRGLCGHSPPPPLRPQAEPDPDHRHVPPSASPRTVTDKEIDAVLERRRLCCR